MVYIAGNRPAAGKTIAALGFDEIENTNIRYMLATIGGSYMPEVSEASRPHVVVVKFGSDSALIDRSKQLGAQVVNYQWLVELYFGSTRAVGC